MLFTHIVKGVVESIAVTTREFYSNIPNLRRNTQPNGTRQIKQHKELDVEQTQLGSI
jgi:hypothetical protein